MSYSTTTVEDWKRKEAAGLGRRGPKRDTITGTAAAVAAQQQAFQSSCNSKGQQKQSIKICIARIEMGWEIQCLAKIEMGWRIQLSLAKIENENTGCIQTSRNKKWTG